LAGRTSRKGYKISCIFGDKERSADNKASLGDRNYYCSEEIKTACNIAFAKYGQDFEAMNILSLTIICLGLTSIGGLLILICAFVFQFSICPGQNQHRIPVLRKCRTLAAIIRETSKLRQIVTIFTIFLTTIVNVYGQSKSIVRVDSMLTELTRQDVFSGAVLIADSSNVLLSKGYGYADRENKTKNTFNTRFSLSSGSKIFTGTAITYLAQQGKLKFSDTIGQYIKVP
jgi:Beta-lactamase